LQNTIVRKKNYIFTVVRKTRAIFVKVFLEIGGKINLKIKN